MKIAIFDCDSMAYTIGHGNKIQIGEEEGVPIYQRDELGRLVYNEKTEEQIVDAAFALFNEIMLKGEFTHYVGFIKGDVSNIRGCVSNTRGDVSNIEGNVTLMRGDVSKLKGDVSNIEGCVSKIKGYVSNIRGNIDEAIKEYLKKNNLTELENRIDINLLID